MSSIVPKVADFVQKATIVGLVSITALGLHGAYQASSARIDLAKRVKEQIQAREKELVSPSDSSQYLLQNQMDSTHHSFMIDYQQIAERIAREQAEAAVAGPTPSS
ncbi:hypothetical protein BCR44DRAFT_309368 [Catenaria anguillulae PL171]|uniref:Uncharacterized protein n=1 Tax=Catenaria anguillulae PL171 TaxID=765915 RepID=A0A1Y2HUI3_9FUNG|nr:hypothetical protein BCR44DRAFT_309368 [Catenaria anguillulae PL171]